MANKLIPNLGRCLEPHQGNGFDWQRYQTGTHDPLSSHGRGILLAKNLAFKQLEYTGKGNEVTCVIALTNT